MVSGARGGSSTPTLAGAEVDQITRRERVESGKAPVNEEDPRQEAPRAGRILPRRPQAPARAERMQATISRTASAIPATTALATIEWPMLSSVSSGMRATGATFR